MRYCQRHYALLFTAIGSYTKRVGSDEISAQLIYMPYVSIRSPMVLKSLSQTRVCFPLRRRTHEEKKERTGNGEGEEKVSSVLDESARDGQTH